MAQLLWGFHSKIRGVQKLRGVLENLWGVLLFGGGLVGEWKLSWGIFPWGLLEGAVGWNARSQNERVWDCGEYPFFSFSFGRSHALLNWISDNYVVFN